MAEPFRVVAPEGPTRPVLFDSPHSGRDYPAGWTTVCSRLELRRGEDAYVDELLDGCVRYGITLLCATLPRTFIDVNRAENDVDPAVLEGESETRLRSSEKSRLGLGLIRRYVSPGVVIFEPPMPVAEVRRRIDLGYRPYHARLARLLRELRDAHGRVWHVDWHSMKSVGNAMTPDGPGASRPDFIVGDLDGTSAEPALTEHVVELLRARGHSVAVNKPYKGGEILRRHGRPEQEIHCVQVEMNRGLYLDEARVEKTEGFVGLRSLLDGVAAGLAE